MKTYKKIFENDDFIVIDKPAGLFVHGAEHIKEDSLVEQLIKKYPQITKVGEDPVRPGIMHRLDKLVSGLMVIAKNQKTFDHLKKQFKQRKVEKLYTALVYGPVKADQGEIKFPIRRSSKGHKMVALPATVKGRPSKEGKTAISEFEVIKRYINYTLLKVKIKTGRTHQIRAHFAALGHPVVGDDLYGNKKSKTKNMKLNLGRLFLVATGLLLVDSYNKKHVFNIDIPDKLKKFLKQIK